MNRKIPLVDVKVYMTLRLRKLDAARHLRKIVRYQSPVFDIK